MASIISQAVSAALLSSAALVSCDGRNATEPNELPDVRAFVTGQAAADLQPTGRFRLRDEFASATEDVITATRAVELGKAYLRTWGPIFERDWESEYEATIDLSRLQLDPRIIFAETAFGKFPDGYHPAYKRFFAPHYILIFHIDANPVLVLSLSAYMTEYQIDEHGDFVRPFYSGNELLSHPVRRWRNGRIAISPEVAVERVWRATGTRVTRVPERVWTGDPNEHRLYFGIYSLWKLTLERPVLMKADDTGAEVLSSEIFVDGKGRFLIAHREQPTSFRIAAYRLTAEFDVPPEPVELPIRSELPVRLTVANPVNNSGAVR